MSDMRYSSNNFLLFVRRYILNINFFRLLIGCLFLFVSFFDLYKTRLIHRSIPVPLEGSGINFLALESAIRIDCFIFVGYILLVLIYVWRFRGNKFLRVYLRVIDIFFLFFILYRIYLYPH